VVKGLDNTELRKKVKGYFDQGNWKFNKGATVDEKEEGVSMLIQGLKWLKS